MAAYRKLIFQSTASGSKAVSLPVHATVELTQTYQPLFARTLYRHLDGSAAVRQQWSGKLATEITGRGLIPPGFSQLDFQISRLRETRPALRACRTCSFWRSQRRCQRED